MDSTTSSGTAHIDCACLIHGAGYDWQYVEKLYSMLLKNFSRPIKLHVYTEEHRPVPEHMIKHVLTEWPGVSGHKQSWWYKMQLFDPKHFSGQLLYFDLDIVVIDKLDWICHLPQRCFWAIHDFRQLWKKSSRTINSSVMYFDTETYRYIWDKFQRVPLSKAMEQYRGDQDFITDAVNLNQLRYFDLKKIVSWRWQALDRNSGNIRQPLNRGVTYKTILPLDASILVFHGNPKPHEINDPIITKYWS